MISASVALSWLTVYANRKSVKDHRNPNSLTFLISIARRTTKAAKDEERRQSFIMKTWRLQMLKSCICGNFGEWNTWNKSEIQHSGTRFSCLWSEGSNHKSSSKSTMSGTQQRWCVCATSCKYHRVKSRTMCYDSAATEEMKSSTQKVDNNFQAGVWHACARANVYMCALACCLSVFMLLL